jgi:hypothetical protein
MHCQFRGVCQGMKQTYLYLWYPLFQAQWDRCDQIFVMFGERVFQQTVDIHMGTNCAPLLADLFLYICGILYFKLNGIDAINKITKPRII